MRLAILADIHGNLPALEAVCAELERLQPDAVVLDGDLINAVPFSPQVIDFVRATDWIVVRGNHEFYYLDFGTDRAPDGHEDPDRWGQLHWLVERVNREQGHYLASLPDDRTLCFPGTQPLRVAHGVPGNNRTGFYNQQSTAQIAAKIDHVPQTTLISAHTHVRIDRHITVDVDTAQDPYLDPHIGSYDANLGGAPKAIHRRWHLINPGSVGLPLNGDPRASFAMLESVPEEKVPGGWACTHHTVEYDRRPALAAYTESGMMAAGGVISQLFYWELVTAEAEIIYFYQWARTHTLDPDADIRAAFAAYVSATGRDQYVQTRDPL